ncbi:hypothetical protein [Metabacillus niabensis]|nr:hypothetical protein [Metabacillus niabensis]
MCVDENEEDNFHSLKLPYTGKNMRVEVEFDDEDVNIHHPHVLVKKT